MPFFSSLFKQLGRNDRSIVGSLFPLLRHGLHLRANQTLQSRQTLLQRRILHLQLLLQTVDFLPLRFYLLLLRRMWRSFHV